MASSNNDEEPLGETGKPRTDREQVQRPGAYVQVSGSPRSRKAADQSSGQEAGGHLVDDLSGSVRTRADAPVRPGRGPIGMGQGSAQRAEPSARKQSEAGERAPSPSAVAPRPSPKKAASLSPREIVEVNQQARDPRSESEGVGDAGARVGLAAPLQRDSAAPTRSEQPALPSVLDAQPSLRHEPPAPPRTPWGLIAGVSILSAIIAAAGVVALQEWRKGQPEAAVADPVTPQQAPPTAPLAPPLPTPVAPTAVPEPTVSPEPAPTAVAPPEATPEPLAAPAQPAEFEPAAVTKVEPKAALAIGERVKPEARRISARTRGRAASAVIRSGPSALPPPVSAPAAASTPEMVGEEEPDAIPRNPYATR